MERVVTGELTIVVAESLDPFQFAYKTKWGVEDASLTLLDTVTLQTHMSGFYSWTFHLLFRQ